MAKLGFFNLLTLIFVGCKLGDIIDWSWWLVFSPTIISLSIAIIIIGCVVPLFYRAYKKH